MNIEKYIKDGKVGVLYSPGYGAGWSTWAHDDSSRESMVFCPELCEAVDKGLPLEKITSIAKKYFPDMYLGGLEDIKIVFFEPGTRFRIDEYDGAEYIISLNEEKYYAA